MKNRSMLALLLVLVVCGARNVQAQAAVQAIRGAAEGIEKQVAGSQNAITTGPVDATEKVPPGKIDSDAPKEFSETKSGLKFRVLRKSVGKKPTASDSVEVHYKGWLDDKTIFDSSYQRGETISFPLNRVIPGWTEGMQLVGEGGMIELSIPYKLGYGERGNRTIPPRAQLHFIVELISVK